MKNSLFSLCLLCFSFNRLIAQNQVDLIVHNAKIYTVDAKFSMGEALAIKDGKFVAIGSNAEILSKYQAKNNLNAKGKALFPGFNDAHAHFYGYGSFLQEVNLVGTKSYAEIQQKILKFSQANPNKTWLIGRGWDQNDWKIKTFPDKNPLDKLFPNKPVALVRIDGHAMLVNQKALDLAGVKNDTPDPLGGTIEKKNGQLTGILVDNAMGLIRNVIPAPTNSDIEESLLDAQANCFAVGLTSLADAGLDRRILEIIDKLNQEKKLKMRIYAMLSNNEENRNYYLARGFYKTDYLSIRSFKVYGDGALGSRGACLLAPYNDKPAETGFLLASKEQYRAWIKQIADKGFQINTHAIGDSANRVVLDLYGEYLGGKNDKRWRIEHAQVVNENDLKKFGQYSIIPSVQPTHCTSDMFWAIDRLGKIRIKRAYSYQDLYQQNQLLALGSDFPVEDINPLYGFHAAIARVNNQNKPQGGFQMENAISRENALRGTTIWAAYAAFEENEKGSIEVGKMADFVILDQDIMKIAPEKIRKVKVINTFVGGEKVFGR
jgi:predicted amidohydrolase YtcJ